QHPPLPSFPTRRSSDLDHVAPGRRGLLHAEAEVAQARLDEDRLGHAEGGLDHEERTAIQPQDVLENDRVSGQPERVRRLDEALRSEEHTSELQSLAYLV